MCVVFSMPRKGHQLCSDGSSCQAKLGTLVVFPPLGHGGDSCKFFFGKSMSRQSPLVNKQKAMENDPFIDGLPIKHGDFL